MNTNPNAKRILCYGDSNTHGRIPYGGRYASNERWTGVLQNMLGVGFEVIEEGLGGRTTNIDDAKKPYRNGLTYLRPCLVTHEPIDLCILWLGTNDLKSRFNQSTDDIAESIRLLLKTIKEISEDGLKILVVSPPAVFETPRTLEFDYQGGNAKSLSLGEKLEKVTKEESTFFIDLVKEGVSPDEEEGVHLSKEMHTKIAEIFSKKIKSVF